MVTDNYTDPVYSGMLAQDGSVIGRIVVGLFTVVVYIFTQCRQPYQVGYFIMTFIIAHFIPTQRFS